MNIQKMSKLSILDNYQIIHQDTVAIIQQIIKNFDFKDHVDCYILCLKIIQKILHNPKLNQDPHNLIKLMIDCLEAMS